MKAQRRQRLVFRRYLGLIAAVSVTSSILTGICIAQEVETTAEPDRPMIGLALSGGGAKGFAHVGVLEVLEELRIPVDCIAGTSMGAIVGGLYAAGMSPQEIAESVTQIDWWDILQDEPPRSDLSFRRKWEEQRYLLDFEFGFNNWRFQFPMAIATGQKLNNLLQAWTFNTIFAENFDQLNIPFRAVATDIETGETVVIDHGNLAKAMRASMAVPGAFTPVNHQGHLLIDGGIVKNIPVDVVRAMGADIIIAVDLGAMDAKATRKKLESMKDLLARTYQLLRRPDQDRQMADADIAILPDVSEYSTSAFYLVADLIPCGEAAARGLTEELKPYSVGKEEYQLYLNRQRREYPPPVIVSEIIIREQTNVDERIIRRQIKSRPGTPLDLSVLDADISRIHGLGHFETVEYELETEEGEERLVVLAKEKPWGPAYLHLGLKLEADSEDYSSWTFMLNYTRRQINALGAEWITNLELGKSYGIYSEFYQPLDFSGVFFVAPAAGYGTSIQNAYVGNDRIAEYEVKQSGGSLEGGLQLGKYGQIRAGATYGHVDAQVDVGAADLPGFEGDFGAWIGSIIIDRLDRVVFTRKGYLSLVDVYLSRTALGGADSYDKVRAFHQQYFSYADHTVFVSLQAGSSFGTDVETYDEFLLGGLSSLVGYPENSLRGKYVGAARLGYQHRIAKLPPGIGQGLYLILWGDAANVWQDSDAIDTDGFIHAFGGGLGADTVFGPVYLIYGRAENNMNRIYFSLGTAF